MAKPIAPTPVLKGQAAIDFIQELSQNKKASEEETIRINKGAERINAMLSFSFWYGSFYINNGFVILDKSIADDETKETCPLYYDLFQLIRWLLLGQELRSLHCLSSAHVSCSVYHRLVWLRNGRGQDAHAPSVIRIPLIPHGRPRRINNRNSVA